MGAYVGAAWACGFDGQKLEKLAREMESPWAFWKLIDPAFPPRQGFIRGGAVKKRLMKSIGHVRFAELARPLRVLATNLETLERVVFSSGEVADAVHASIAVPGICVPVIINGETYIDGGIVDPLPVDVLREMGVNRIIAVNAIPTPDRIRYCVQAERELAQLPKKRAREVMRKWLPLDVHLNYFARGNILEILMRSVHGGQIRMAESLGRQADLVLRPQICEDNWMDFRNPGRFIKPGRQIAERFLGEIKALVARKAVENESALEPMAAVA
jgi:NTE family protein